MGSHLALVGSGIGFALLVSVFATPGAITFQGTNVLNLALVTNAPCLVREVCMSRWAEIATWVSLVTT